VLEETMRELAPFIESLEFVPAPPAAPEPPPAAAMPGVAAPPGGPAAPVVIDLERVGRATDAAALHVVVKQALEEARAELATAASAAHGAVGERTLASEAVQTSIQLRESYECPVEEGGRLIGKLRARIAAKRVLLSVLGGAERGEGEIPFALDAEGTLYSAAEGDRERLAEVGTAALRGEGEPDGDWVVVRTDYPGSDLRFGIARPLSDSLRELRRAAGSNLGFGLGLVSLALVGIVPLSRRITRDLGALTAGARRLAAGDLDVEVPVRSRDEVGRLTATFNRMARDLEENQRRLVESELQHRLVETENRRRGEELEEARRFQLSLLPKALPEHPDLELAVFMRTATEVGGDYYDFHLGADGALTVAVGDATGHGAKAGTMVTVIKALFTAQAPGADPPSFLAEAASSIRRMELGRMAMALLLARIEGRRLLLSSAGMPPVLVCRGGEVREIALQGLPLGGMAQAAYQRHETTLERGDLVLLMSDGLPELVDDEGEPFGYTRVRTALSGCGELGPQGVITALEEAAHRWTGDRPPGDDVTFVAIRVR
jgi:serine phosphatase RsbU (regulator of sigma subunit)